MPNSNMVQLLVNLYGGWTGGWTVPNFIHWPSYSLLQNLMHVNIPEHLRMQMCSLDSRTFNILLYAHLRTYLRILWFTPSPFHHKTSSVLFSIFFDCSSFHSFFFANLDLHRHASINVPLLEWEKRNTSIFCASCTLPSVSVLRFSSPARRTDSRNETFTEENQYAWWKQIRKLQSFMLEPTN